MLERLTDLPRGVEGVKAAGKVSKEDYERVLAPMLARAKQEHRRMKFLYELGPELDAFTPAAAWEDARLGLGSIELFDGCAVVSDLASVRAAVELTRFFMPCPVRVFGASQREQAVAWLEGLSESPTLAARLLPEAGVLVVELRQALRDRDFDALSQTVDPWIASHGKLQGVVVHARAFPGWENVPSFVRHMQFLLGHRQKIRRLAFAVDGAIAHVAPHIAGLVLKPEVKTFGYDRLLEAIAWASGEQPAQAEAFGYERTSAESLEAQPS